MDDELLTTKEVEQLVRLNRVTIYRLIREGEFPAIKVGGQWRFPRAAIEDWLARQASANLPGEPAASEELPSSLDDLFFASELRPILRAFAEATGLSIFLTDLEGNRLMECIEYNPFCQAFHEVSGGQKACYAAHSACVYEIEQPETYACPSGMKYLSAPIDIDGEQIALAIVGPMITDEFHMESVRQILPQVSQDIGAQPGSLLANMHAVQEFSPPQIAILGRLLSKVLSATAQVAFNRRGAAQRLKEIARLATMK